MSHTCIKCGADLIIGVNCTKYQISTSHYNCQSCRRIYNRERQRKWSHRTGRQQPMNENRECAAFLGVHVAERVLSCVFKNVERLLYGTPGYDFICGRGYKIDVKSSCRYHFEKIADRWIFSIRKNRIADHFLCLAFDNRESLNPTHLWLIAAEDINDHVSASISETRLDKWNEYELDINKVSTCCNILKEAF